MRRTPIDAKHYSIYLQEKRCQYCFGNDGDAPCAYPGENKPGCLRDERLRNVKTSERAPPDE